MSLIQGIINKSIRERAVREDNQSRQERDLIAWGKKYVPHKVEKPCSDLHRTQARECDKTTRGRKLNIIAPRGNAKTTWLEVDNLRDICEKGEAYIIIIMDTLPQSKALLEGIKYELENNPEIKRDYPEAFGKGPVWNADKIETNNGVCVEAVSVGAKVRGRRFRHHRPTKVVVDDPDNDEDIKSPTLRADKKTWFEKALLNCGTKNTNFFVIGTMIDRECIVGICSRRADFNTIEFQAIRKWPVRMDLWAKFESIVTNPNVAGDKKKADAFAFYTANQADMDLGAEVLWPEEESLYELMMLRATNGHAAFESEKQNNPRDPSKCEWPESYFEGDDIYYDLPWLVKQQQKREGQFLVCAYGDPAKGKDLKRGDYNCLITGILFENDPSIYLKVYIRKVPIKTFIDDIVKLIRQNGIHALAIESTGMQELIGDELETKLVEERIASVLPLDISHDNVNKVIRIQRLGPWLSRRVFKFQKDCPDTQLLLQQLRDFPNQSHDDGPDGLEGLVRTIVTIQNTEE